MGSLMDLSEYIRPTAPSGPKAHLRRQQKAHPAQGRKTPRAYFPRIAPAHAAHAGDTLGPTWVIYALTYRLRMQE
jgi:hypothetical protein